MLSNIVIIQILLGILLSYFLIQEGILYIKKDNSSYIGNILICIGTFILLTILFVVLIFIKLKKRILFVR